MDSTNMMTSNRNKIVKIEKESIIDGEFDSSSDESYEIPIKNESSDEDFLPGERNARSHSFKRLKTSSKNPIRQPTRRPDPNTFNRNALMARENRRRKKEYVEQLEKKIKDSEIYNHQLRKMLKKQSRVVQKLQDEKRYYQNIFSNKSEILAVLKAVKGSNLPCAHPITNETPETSPSYIFPNVENAKNKCIGDDDYGIPFDNHESWENLLGCNSPFSEDFDMGPVKRESQNSLQDIQSNISGEHNYVNMRSTDEDDEYKDSGVCIHISGGKISLEFCPTCHYQATESTTMNNLLD